MLEQAMLEAIDIFDKALELAFVVRAQVYVSDGFGGIGALSTKWTAEEIGCELEAHNLLATVGQSFREFDHARYNIGKVMHLGVVVEDDMPRRQKLVVRNSVETLNFGMFKGAADGAVAYGTAITAK
jgi:hypothetical protein